MLLSAAIYHLSFYYKRRFIEAVDIGKEEILAAVETVDRADVHTLRTEDTPRDVHLDFFLILLELDDLRWADTDTLLAPDAFLLLIDDFSAEVIRQRHRRIWLRLPRRYLLQQR